jgi:hypothetical protein
MIQVHNPVKKLKNYVAKVTTLTGKPLRLRVDATYMSMATLEKGGQTMKVYIPDADVARHLSEVDDFVRAETIERNGDWFDNELDPEVINTLFRDSLNKVHNTMTVLLSDSKEPNWFVNEECVDSEVPLHSGANIGLDLEVQGVFFYSKKFGVRWIVRNVYIGDHHSENDTTSHLDLDIDKNHIQECWRRDVDDLHVRIDEDIASLKSSIGRLESLKLSMESDLENARSQPDINGAWETALTSLAKNCKLYMRGDTIV